MDTLDGAGGAEDDGFADKLMSKARKVQLAAVQKRAEEIGDGGTSHLDPAEEMALYRTQTGRVIGGDVLPGSRQWAALEDWYSWIPGIFEPFAHLPNPSNFSPIIDEMKSVIGIFGGDADHPEANYEKIDSVVWGNMDSTANYLAQWRGRAATTFDSFSDPFQQIPHNHCALAYILKQGVEANKQIFVNVRRDICAVADSTVAALLGQDFGAGTDISYELTVVAAVAGFLSTVSSFGATLPIVFGAVAAGASIGAARGSSHQKKDPSERVTGSIGGHTADTVLDSMIDATKQLTKLVGSEEDKIVEVLDRNYETITSPNEEVRRQIIAPRPRLADISGADIDTKMAPPTLRP